MIESFGSFYSNFEPQFPCFSFFAFSLDLLERVCYTINMIYYNTPFLKNIFNKLSNLLNASITLYNQDFRSTENYSERIVPLCACIKNNRMRSLCMLSDSNVLNSLKDNESTCFTYNCHFGFKEIIMKLVHKDVILAYVIIGPFRDETRDGEVAERLEALCKNENVEREQIFRQYEEMPLFTEEKYESIKTLCISLFNYAIVQNMITMRENVFSAEIEPYIQRNLHLDLSVEHLCKQFFLSRKQLNTIFLKNVNESPKKYVNRQRVLKALNMLILTDKSSDQIAEAVGINDYNYFIKVFKSFDGHTPSFYRKKKKNR